MNKFHKYKFLKAKLKIDGIYDYPLEKITGSYLANFIWLKPREKFRFFIFCVIYKFEIPKDCNILITSMSERKSYIKMLYNYALIKKIKSPSIIKIETIRRPILEIIILFFYLFKNFKNYKDLNFTQIFILNFLKTYAAIIIKGLESKEIKCEKYIAFNSSYLFESFLSYYFRKRKIPTYSLQHGMYFKYKENIPLDVINYENICSENLLCWGDYSIDEIKELIPHDVKLIKDIYPYKYKNNLDKKISINKILVLLPREIYLHEIKNLLKILTRESEDQKYIIRPHPTIVKFIKKIIKNHANLEIDLEEELHIKLSTIEFKFCIGFNTSSLFEAALFKQKIVQYISNNDEFIMSNIPTFKTKDDYKKIQYGGVYEKEEMEYYFNTIK